MRTFASTAAALLVSALTGCANFQSAANFKPSDLSGVEDSKSALLLIRPDSSDVENSPALTAAINQNTEIRDVLTKQCRYKPPQEGPGPKVPAALVPVLSALVELGFNLWADQQQRNIEAIVAAAQADYAATRSISVAELDATQCAAFVRYTQPAGKPVQLGLFVALKLRLEEVPVGAPFKLLSAEPVYARMFNAVALTKDSSEPKASLSVALSVKAVGKPDGGLERLLPSGEGVVSIPQVRLGSTAPAKCAAGGCKRSDLIPYPTARGTLSFTMAVAERGVTGFDDKAASAELAAIKAALGPAIGEAVKKKFGD